MFKLVLLLTLVLVVTCFKLQFANLASILGANRPNSEQILVLINESAAISQLEPHQASTILPDTTTTSRSSSSSTPSYQVTTTATMTSTSESRTTLKPKPTTDSGPSNHDASTISSNLPNATETSGTSTTTTTTTTSTTTTPPSLDAVPLPPSLLPPLAPPDVNQPDTKPNANKPPAGSPGGRDKSSAELGILFYSVFIVYVSLVKLIYHNIHMINHNLTEQGILMIFGILWQLVARKLLTTDHGAFPRFNSRIFFYLFLPSTVLESASLLSNKWLFFNLLPILTHSIIGTVLYTSSMGFTIFSLARSNVFAQNWIGSSSNDNSDGGFVKLELSLQQQQSGSGNDLALTTFVDPSATNAATNAAATRQQNDLTLAECLIFGTILSSIDSAPMLTVFKQYQVNEKLYYLVLGENLMNNAVVITIFNSLIDLFETTKLTVFRIYLATLQFFANLVGAVFIGLALALFALISVRLTKRFQLPGVLLSYGNQCQAMVETLLILKLAYLTYTLANMAGCSSIVGLATFGILNDQYIKHNLNLRSQLAFKQVILGMKTMGFSLVYPLLGMLLVDTALTQHGVLNESSSTGSSSASSSVVAVGRSVGLMGPPSKQSAKLGDQTLALNFRASFQNESGRRRQLDVQLDPTLSLWNYSSTLEEEFVAVAVEQTAGASSATKKLTHLASQANINWYAKFLSIVILLTVIYRFLIVIALGLIGNVLTCGQLKIKFKEQLLMAYGGFKGPLSMALVHSLMEHDNHREKNTRNKHLFKYTVLMNIFISAVLAGTFIRPLVARIQTTLIGRVSTNLEDAANPTIVFDQVNYKLTEYVSHGLNSILGHSRSPYEKFIEFNETHIKPWLVRGGSNTNWLSVFYDNLILDETLNANCFHIATEDPTTMRAFRNAEQHKMQRRARKSNESESGGGGGNRWTNMWRRRSSSVSFLDTIDEMPKKPAQPGPLARNANEHNRPRRPKVTGGVSIVSGESQSLASGSQQVPKDREVLKEFVLFNLKLENARRRRQTQKRRFATNQLQQQYHESPSPIGPIRPKFMVDNSSSNLTDSSMDRASRRVHLDELEARLAGNGPVGFSKVAGAFVGGQLEKTNTQRPIVSQSGSRHGGTFDRGLRPQFDKSGIGAGQASPATGLQGRYQSRSNESPQQGPSKIARVSLSRR